MNEKYVSVEVISRRVRLTPAMVRRYTQLGLVAPSAWSGRTPMYGEADIARLRKVVRLTRDLGLNLAGVEVVLRLLDRVDELQREMAALREEER